MEKETVMKKEVSRPVEFTQVKKLWNDAFGKDLEIVGHPNTLKRTPFNGVNLPDAHGRQYNLTVIPENLTEIEFLHAYGNCDTLFVSCMDKDASGPGYNELTKTGKVMLISMAGGIIQFPPKNEAEPNRQLALQVMLGYLSEHHQGKHIKKVMATDHNHTCGYIKVKGLNMTALSEKIGGQPADDKENVATKKMIKYYATEIGIQKYFPEALLQLAKIDRQGNIEFEDIKDDIESKSLADIIA